MREYGKRSTWICNCNDGFLLSQNLCAGLIMKIQRSLVKEAHDLATKARKHLVFSFVFQYLYIFLLTCTLLPVKKKSDPLFRK